MPKELTKPATDLTPRPNPTIARLKNLICLTPHDFREPVGLSRALTDIERATAKNRVAEIDRSLAARDRSAVRSAVSALMLAYPSSRASGDEAKAVIAAYEFALADLPPWAVNEAVQKFIRGHVPSANPAFAPSSSEVHRLATEACRYYEDERSDLRRLLSGVPVERPVSPEDRERVAAGFDALAASLPSGQARQAKTEAAMRQAAEGSLRAMLAELGQDESELDRVPNAPDRPGTFRRPGAA